MTAPTIPPVLTAATVTRAGVRNFLGSSPRWYKVAIGGLLAANPLLLLAAGPTVAGWAVVAEFIFVLTMSLRCYPLQPGGLLAVEAIAIGLASADGVRAEVESNLPVLLLVVFLVTSISFLRELLLVAFTKLLLALRSKVLGSVSIAAGAAIMSAFLDALTVLAVVIAVCAGLYGVYHRFASQHPSTVDDWSGEHPDLDQFRAFLRSLLMHAAVGTAVGGVATLVGEPQNLLIGERMGWDFVAFLVRLAPVSVPVAILGLGTTAILEATKLFGYGATLPDSVRHVLVAWDREQREHRDARAVARLVVQGLTAALLIAGLGLHVAEVGLVGLGLLVVVTAFNGIVSEQGIGHAFHESLPFAALLVVFFAIVAVIHAQDLFGPITRFVLDQPTDVQAPMLYGAAGVLSMISDNVFVGTIYIDEIAAAFHQGLVDADHADLLAVAVNAGTNLPGVATPNGQAAFLFLLTSALAPLIRLGYARMVWMALPYSIVLTATGLVAVMLWV
jgi:NhaB family Na+:H+ antiporter